MSISKSDSSCLKGIMAILVLIHHLYQNSGVFHENLLGVVFQDMGYVAVAVFFFLSGYGLSISYRIKGRMYLKHFLRNRVLVLYCEVLFLIALYAGYEIILHNTISWKLIFQSMTYGETIIKLGWYLQTTMLLYVAYFLVFSTKWKDRSKYVGMVVVVLMYCGLCILLRASLTRYVTVINFLIGMFCDYGHKKTNKVPNLRVYFITLTGTFLVFLLTHVIEMKFLKNFFLMLLSVGFTIIVIMTVKFVKINYKTTRCIGKISLEIYVIQGLFLSLFHSKMVYIENPYVYISVVTVFTLLFAKILNMIFVLIAHKISAR